MEIPVSAQALTFAQGALLGLGLCLAYDLLRALRQLCPRTGLAADALFGLLLTASFLSFALTAGQGQFRLYVFLAVFLTAVLYFLTLSRMVLAVSDKIISAVKYMLGLFGRIVTMPFRLLWLVFCRPARKIGGFCEKQRKKLLQSVKLCVKIIIHRLHINRRMLRKK